MARRRSTYAFYVLYANIDGFNPTEYKLDKSTLSVMDKWILSKLNSAVKSVDECLGSYKITEATRILEGFVDELSNWYVRRSRERFWVKDMPTDKVNAYLTLYNCLVTIAKISSPMIPFMAEDIYRNLVCSVDKSAPVSIHLCTWPELDADMIDKSSMEFFRQEYCSGLPCPSPGDLPDPGIKPRSSTLQADSLPSESPRKPKEGLNNM